jgi:hypothetical protein
MLRLVMVQRLPRSSSRQLGCPGGDTMYWREQALLSRLSERIRRLFRNRETVHDEVDGYEPFRKLFGPTGFAAIHAFFFGLLISVVSAEIAKRWQPVTDPTLYVWTLAMITAWISGFRRCFRYIGWPPWLAFPYVLLILCPWAWVFAYRHWGPIFVFILQLPVIVVYVHRTRNRNKAKS